jgi:hypothetical protein
MHMLDDANETELFDYGMEAELYTAKGELYSAKGRNFRKQQLGYRRFARAADAIRFVVEELPPQLLPGTCIEVKEARYESGDIRRLYDSASYPFVRRATVSLG